MKLYLAGPLFTGAERAWNAELAAALRDGGHEVFLPQEKQPGMDAAGIFAADVAAIDWADALIAIMDGSDPDPGTAWEVGYAFRKKPVLVVRTDLRTGTENTGPYNESATIWLDLPAAQMRRVVEEVLDALTRLWEPPAWPIPR